MCSCAVQLQVLFFATTYYQTAKQHTTWLHYSTAKIVLQIGFWSPLYKKQRVWVSTLDRDWCNNEYWTVFFSSDDIAQEHT